MAETKHRLVVSDANLGSDDKAVAVTQQPIRILMSKCILCNKLLGPFTGALTPDCTIVSFAIVLAM